MAVTLHTSEGDIKMELYCAEVPKICFNFLALAASGFYDGLTFHRNMAGFMLQGGDPTGKGKGGEESIWGEKLEHQFHPNIKHSSRGVVSMANGSQFFITYQAQPHLDGVYSAFAQVVKGWDVLDKIEALPVGKKSRPINKITIQSVTIHANPLAS